MNDCRFRRQSQRQAVGSNQETTKFVISGPVAVAVQGLYQPVAFETVACNWHAVFRKNFDPSKSPRVLGRSFCAGYVPLGVRHCCTCSCSLFSCSLSGCSLSDRNRTPHVRTAKAFVIQLEFRIQMLQSCHGINQACTHFLDNIGWLTVSQLKHTFYY